MTDAHEWNGRMCPYFPRYHSLPGYNPEATCVRGCVDEPECITGEPRGGWPPLERDFDLAAVDRAAASVLDRGPAGYGSYDDLLERCEKAARALEHQAALEPVGVMAARLRGKAQGVRLAVSFLKEAHQSGHPDFAFVVSHSDENRST